MASCRRVVIHENDRGGERRCLFPQPPHRVVGPLERRSNGSNVCDVDSKQRQLIKNTGHFCLVEGLRPLPSRHEIEAEQCKVVRGKCYFSVFNQFAFLDGWSMPVGASFIKSAATCCNAERGLLTLDAVRQKQYYGQQICV